LTTFRGMNWRREGSVPLCRLTTTTWPGTMHVRVVRRSLWAPWAFVLRCGGSASRHSEERSDEESGGLAQRSEMLRFAQHDGDWRARVRLRLKAALGYWRFASNA